MSDGASRGRHRERSAGSALLRLSRRSSALRLVVGQATRVAGVGVILGLFGAAALTRVMTALLFDVSPLDPLTFTSSAVLLLGVAALASYLPARRGAPRESIRKPPFEWTDVFLVSS